MEAIGDRTMRRLRVYAEYRAAGDPIHKISILGRQQKLLVAAGKEVNGYFLNYLQLEFSKNLKCILN